MRGLTPFSFQYLLMAQAASWKTNTSGAAFDNTSSLSIRTGAAGARDFSVNMVVKDNGTFYISQDSMTSATSTFSLTISDPNSKNWVAFDPTAMAFDGQVAGSVTGGSPLTFSNIEAVGFMARGTTEPGEFGGRLNLDNWTVNAVPEPSSLALLGLGLPLLLRRRR